MGGTMSQESELKTEQRDLLKELMTMMGDFDDLRKDMEEWLKKFMLLRKKIGNNLED